MSLSGFADPWWFLLLLAVAALVFGYVLVQRRRRRNVMRFTNLAMLDKVAPKRQNWWRHGPAAVLGVALLVLTVALAGPTAEQKVPRNRAIVMLVVDTSQSMKATDVRPTRIGAAKVAAKSFVTDLTPGINLGLISFAGSAVTLVSPTTDRGPVVSSIDSLKLADSTATGEAIFSALHTIKSFGEVVAGPNGPPPARIVLMSDGKQTVPTWNPDDPRGGYTAARAAKKQGVPVSTISFGTVGASVDVDGTPVPVDVDDESLHEIANLSAGNFFKAASADELKKVYDTIGEQIGYEKRVADASRPWLIFGTALAIIAAAGAIGLNQRVP
ncbi:VWA domain-containing protein [Sciscionella marina]|uniref:VWA domain-containing protein n=1 Tax=Sciscionella marina TaxID=508770 RepID=UPI00036EE3B0|nr:VWA domain-containing protein [Sciscionella marina]